MAKKISIPINYLSPPPDDECTLYHVPQYRVTGAVGWNTLPATTLTPIEISGLSPSTGYDIRINRFCCNGQQSYTDTTYTTGA